MKVSHLPQVRKVQTFVTIKGPGEGVDDPDYVEDDTSYYFDATNVNRHMYVPVSALILSDETAYDYQPVVDPRHLRRQNSIFISGCLLQTKIHFRFNFDFVALLVDVPGAQTVRRFQRSAGGYGDLPVDVFSANFSATQPMGSYKYDQIWRSEDMHLPMLQRRYNPKARILFRKEYRLRVNEAKQMSAFDLRLWGPVSRFHRYEHAFDPSEWASNQPPPQSHLTWILVWEPQWHGFDSVGIPPIAFEEDQIHRERVARGGQTALIMDRLSVRIFFRERLLPLPITDASYVRKMIEPGS